MQHRLYPLVACAVLSLAACGVQAEPLRPDNTVGDVLAHPAFTGFAERLLPWDDGRNDPAVKLSQTARLMPYHQNIRTDEVLGGLNRLIRDAEAGKTVFYDIYSESERRADPSKRHTGLFVFHGKPDAPSVVISAGGGFAYVGSLHEAFPIAKAVSEQGYNAFVVKYRAGKGAETATQDVAKAIEFITQNQKHLQTDMRAYSLWGGHLQAPVLPPTSVPMAQNASVRTATANPLPSLCSTRDTTTTTAQAKSPLSPLSAAKTAYLRHKRCRRALTGSKQWACRPLCVSFRHSDTALHWVRAVKRQAGILKPCGFGRHKENNPPMPPENFGKLSDGTDSRSKQ